MTMIPQIIELYLRLDGEFASHKYEESYEASWTWKPEDIAYLEQIKTIDDLGNYDHNNDYLCALAYDCALAMGLSKWDAMSVANDH